MNSRKDILLIAAGALLLCIGVFAYLGLQLGMFPGIIRPIVIDNADEKAALIRQLKEQPPQGAVYPSSPLASLEDNVKDWLSPEENDDNWDYDLFTTIDVVWDASIKDYVPRSRKAEVLPPFGISLVSVGHPTYPFIVIETILPRNAKEEDRLFTLQNIKTKQYVEGCKLNKPIPDAAYLTLKAFKVVKDKDADGIITVRQVLTVDDRQFGQIVDIDDIKPLEFAGRTDIVIASASEPGWTKTLHLVGEKFTYNQAVYTVKEIDLASKTVTFDKHFAPNPKKPKKTFSESLSVPAPPPPPPPKPKTKSPTVEKTPTKK
ncbi:MAG: hypothetical protein WCJ96_00085 [Verrucomicrobiota bacterium]